MIKCIIGAVGFLLLAGVAWWALARRTTYGLLPVGGPDPLDNAALWEPQKTPRAKRIKLGCLGWSILMLLAFGVAYLIEDVNIVDALRPSPTPSITPTQTDYPTATATVTDYPTATKIYVATSGVGLGGLVPTSRPTNAPSTATQKPIYIQQTVIVTRIITGTAIPTFTPYPTQTPYYTQTPWILIVTSPPQTVVVTATATSTETLEETPTETPTETLSP